MGLVPTVVSIRSLSEHWIGIRKSKRGRQHREKDVLKRIHVVSFKKDYNQ